MAYCKIFKSRPMKKYLFSFTVIFFVTFSHAQRGFGFGVGIATSKAPMVDIRYFLNKNAVSIGVSYQIFNDALGKKNKELIPDTHAIGDGYYFFSVDIGYTRILSEKFSVSGEVSIAKKTHYQNLKYDNLSQESYHRTLKTTSVIGVGGIIIYNANDFFGIFAGYNSIREASIGVQFKFVH